MNLHYTARLLVLYNYQSSMMPYRLSISIQSCFRKFNHRVYPIFYDTFMSIENFLSYRKLEFEKAYCLYRLNHVTEAFKIIDAIQNPSLKVKELKAQIFYRLERFEECFAVYRDIIKNSTDEYEDEREANLAAVLVHLALEGSVRIINHLCFSCKTYILICSF